MLPQDQLKIISNCPVCNSHNFPANIKILNQNDEAHLLHVQCRKCQSCVLVLISFNAQGINTIGLLTDLRSDEVMKLGAGEPISSDDILELYQLFETKEGICL